MKKISLFIVMLCAFSFVDVSAQNNVLRLSPLAFAKMKTRIHYERALTEKLSGGAMASYFFGIYPGFRIEPFARYYLTDEALTGLYVQGKGHFSSNSISIESKDMNNVVISTWKHSFSEVGGSLCLGWQFMMGANENISLDFYTGYRFSNLKALDNQDISGFTQDEIDNRAAEIGFRILHANTFDLGVSLGYRF